MGRREGTQARPGTEREGTKPGASHFNSVPGGRMPGKLDRWGALRPRGWAGSAGGAAGETNGGAGKELGGGEERKARGGSGEDTQPGWSRTFSGL